MIRKHRTPAAIIHALVQEAVTKNCEGEACKKKRVKKFKLFIPNLLHWSEGGVPTAHESVSSARPQLTSARGSLGSRSRSLARKPRTLFYMLK